MMPKTREQLTGEFIDELRGRLAAAFAEAESRRLAGDGGGSEKDAAAMGRFMAGQMRWAGEFLGRVADFAGDVKAVNGKPEASKEKRP